MRLLQPFESEGIAMIQATVIIFPDLELEPMGLHVQSDGSNVGGVDPAKYGALVPPGDDPFLLLYQSGTTDKTGKGYPAMEVYPISPITIPANTGHMELSFRMTVDENTALYANVIETDILLIIKGKKYNLSGQRHVQTGQIDVGMPGAGWLNTGCMAGPILPHVEYLVKWTYYWSVADETYSVLTYEANENVWTIPRSAQNFKAEASDWKEGIALLQTQFGNFPAGFPILLKVANCKIRFW